MLSITEIIPANVIDAIGAARTVGRDRWEDLKKLFNVPKNAERANEIIASSDFMAADSVGRFNVLATHLKTVRRSTRKQGTSAQPLAWTAHDQRVAARYRNTGKTFSLSLTANDAGAFGEYISSNLEALYRAFREAKVGNKPGD